MLSRFVLAHCQLLESPTLLITLDYCCQQYPGPKDPTTSRRVEGIDEYDIQPEAQRYYPLNIVPRRVKLSDVTYRGFRDKEVLGCDFARNHQQRQNRSEHPPHDPLDKRSP